MIRLTKYIALLVSAVTLLSACNEAYPELYVDEEKEETKELASHELLGRIPIIPALNDEQYSVYTRGVGAFENWGVDDSKWINARFRCFAQLTDNQALQDAQRNGYYSGGVNFSARDSIHCLNIWDVPMKMNREKYIHFIDNDGNPITRWYNYSFQDFKYRLAAVHVDDAVTGEPRGVQENGVWKIKMPITIDGSQDVIHAYAYHTAEKIAEETKKLLDDQDKIFNGNVADYLYSSWAGRRGFNPIFHANHLLTKFSFNIKGVAKNGKKEYQNVIIRNVKIQSRNEGTVTILDDGWTDGVIYEAQEASESLMDFDPNKVGAFWIKKKTNSLAPVLQPYIDKEGFYTREEADTLLHVTSSEYVPLSSEGVLVYPDSRYRLMITIDYINGQLDNDGNLSGMSWSKESENYFLMRQTVVNYTIDASILKLEDNTFKSGRAYTVYLNVYGPEQIVGTLEPSAWEEVDDIGTDSENDGIDPDD